MSLLSSFFLFSFVIFILCKQCISEGSFDNTTTLVILSKDANDISDVIVKKFNESLELVCVYKNGRQLSNISWDFTPTNSNSSIDINYIGKQNETEFEKILSIERLRLNHTGHYSCESFGLVATKYVLVQNSTCAMRGAFHCSADNICISGRFVCDGRPDCSNGADETLATCGTDFPCLGKLMCSDNRCIPESVCCNRLNHPTCSHPACCDMLPYGRFSLHEFETTIDEKRIDDYGFLQTTIYTVTACALIFMMAIVLLVSAICKMHMKRASACMHAPPPYLHQPPPPPLTPQTPFDQSETTDANVPPIGFARLTNTIFHSRYRPIPQSVDIISMMTDQLERSRSPELTNYSSPANGELYFENGSDLTNYLECSIARMDRDREISHANAVERLFSGLSLASERAANPRRPLTLQLGRLQVNIPRFSRDGRRPDTPNVAEVDLNDVDFVRLNSDETYTLNGRTIRLLGADFENCPVINGDFVGTVISPPPYSECIGTAPAKVFGPPPAYLSLENLMDEPASTVDNGNETDGGGSTVADANGNRADIELPPRYEELPAEVNERDVNGNG